MQQPIQLTIPAGAKIIEAYGADGFTVSGEKIGADLLIYGATARGYEGINLDACTLEQFADIFLLTPKPNLVLFGTGAKHVFVAPPVRAHFRERGIGFETMDTGSAVRTYNILLAEGREVAGLFVKPAFF